MAGKAKVVITYEDGTIEEFNPNRPRLLLDMERKFGVQEPETHAHVNWLAYHALVELKGKDDALGFEDFVDSIDDMDTIQSEGDADKSGEADPS